MSPKLARQVKVPFEVAAVDFRWNAYATATAHYLLLLLLLSTYYSIIRICMNHVALAAAYVRAPHVS